ncbi:MAG: PadR family transcriptional regulator [Angelakisella sp.]|jgi:DNA-binding PadR family transcriptional regulator|nr:PadR family transcriptional regulator [Angelakisella sp.]
MPREKFKTLTEQMYYILLCLGEECCGIDVMDRIPALTGGRVKVGSGTLYHLLEEFLAAGLIRETRAEGRRRSYLLTPEGRALLDQEYRRICRQAEDYRRCFEGSDQG